MEKSPFSPAKKSTKNLIKTSFFDDYINEDIKTFEYPPFWLKQAPNFNLNQHFEYISPDIIHSGHIFKKSRKTKKFKLNYYELYLDRLIRFVNNEPKRYLMLKGVKCDVLEQEDTSLDTENKFSEENMLIFAHNKSYCILYTQNKKELFKWFEKLKECCILSNFSKFYNTKKVIGKGSFAQVILSSRIKDNKMFAVKTFDKIKLMQPKSAKTRSGLINEINIMRLIDDENIIKVYEVYEGSCHIYLVLELLNGGELFESIIKKGKYTEKDAGVIICKLLKALIHIHSKNIMHRDIKPENLILKERGSFEMKLADFGLADFSNKKQRLFTRCGTPGYVAPEVLLDQPYDTKVDVFSGVSPFYGKNYNEILSLNKKAEIKFNIFEKIKISPEGITPIPQGNKSKPKKQLYIFDAEKLQQNQIENKILKETEKENSEVITKTKEITNSNYKNTIVINSPISNLNENLSDKDIYYIDSPDSTNSLKKNVLFNELGTDLSEKKKTPSLSHFAKMKKSDENISNEPNKSDESKKYNHSEKIEETPQNLEESPNAKDEKNESPSRHIHIDVNPKIKSFLNQKNEKNENNSENSNENYYIKLTKVISNDYKEKEVREPDIDNLMIKSANFDDYDKKNKKNNSESVLDFGI